jgi:NADPH:quinone reductase-like Zn-dependent oxidoreductase
MKMIGNDLEPEDGTFAEYIVVKGDVAMHIPDNISFEEAATLGCGIFTNALGLYRYLELPLLTFPLEDKRSDEPPLLIYGGSSASGTLAIQFAKLFVILLNFSVHGLIQFRSGLTVITTASPRNFDLLKKLGADHVLDYVCIILSL